MMSEFDTAHREVMKALEGFNTGLASEATKPRPFLSRSVAGRRAGDL